ncbi:MAG: hypothetical protein JWM62_841 [Frankiales bacterium]|nr:hypothetical protein [Frankiales bacterium]
MFAEAVVAFVLQDPRISESSGLASATSPGIVYTHNDSGDEARFFAVDTSTGRTRTVYALPDVQARDWEDMARGPDEDGVSSLWLGDIGDNNARRDLGLLVHRVREPEPTSRERVTTEPPTSFRLRYPDGPGDAEALLVHPRTGRLYVVTKPLSGGALVYAAPTTLDPDGPNVLERVGSVRLEPTGTPGGPGIGGLAQLLVTAGDIAPNGSHVALRTYTDLYEWEVEGDDVAGAFAGKPTVTALPESRQGEGLAYTADGSAVLLSTEGAGTPVHRVPVARAELAEEAPPVDRLAPSSRVPYVVGGGLLLALLLVVRGAVRRRRYTRR